MATIKPTIGSVKMIDKASSVLKNISGNFKKLGTQTQLTNKKTSSFQEKLQKTSRNLNQLNRRLIASKKAFGNYATGIGKIASVGGLITGGGITLAINKQAESLDKLGKKAGNLNLPISELQALRHQAVLSGLTTDELDSSLTRFTKRLGVFQVTGGGLLSTIAKKIGNGFGEALKSAKSNTEAYEILLKAYSKLETQQEKMALSDAAFGMSGRKSLLMLDEGIQGLTKSRQRLSSLGAIITKSQVKTAENFNDSLAIMKQPLEAIKRQALTPILKNLTDIMIDFTEKFKNVDYREETIRKVTNTLNDLFDGLKAITKGFSFLVENSKNVVGSLLLLKTTFIGLNAVMILNPIGALVTGVGLLTSATILLSDSWKDVISNFKTAFSWISKIIDFVKDVNPISNMLKLFDNFLGASPQLSPVVNSNITRVQDNISQFQNNNTNNNINNNQIKINIMDNQIKSVESVDSTNTRTNVFLDEGTQY